MKTKIRILKQLITLCCAFAAVPAFGQYTLTWVGGAGVDFGNTNNWVGDIFAPISGTTCVFNGSQAGNLVLVSSNGIVPPGGTIIGGNYGASGIRIHLTSSQTGSVQLICATNLASALGMGFNGAILDNGVGSLILGDNTANQLILTLRPSPPSIHGFTNNSANPMIWMPNAQIQNGGGAAGHVMVFAGAGDFGITNNLRWGGGAPPPQIEMDGTGTFYWTAGGPNDLFNSGQGTITINSGTVILKSAGLLPNTAGFNLVTNNATLIFDAAGQSDTIVRSFYGAGTLIVTNGTWNFTSQNSTNTGPIILNGGELIAGGYENVTNSPLGELGTISFNGGTLGFSTNNTYDYSSRFSTAANQQYSIDVPDGLTVTFATGLSSSGGSLTKIGAGVLTLNGPSTYTGATTINDGKLLFKAGKPGTGNITVADNAALGVTDTGTQITPTTLTLGSSAGCTLEFNNINSTTTAPLAVGTLGSAGIITININSGILVPGQSYPLFSWTTGSPPAVKPGSPGADGALSTNGNTIQLTIPLPARPLLNFTQSSNSLQFSWTDNRFKLQWQTNDISVGLSSNWMDYPRGDASPVTVPMDVTNGTVFFRLVPLP